MVSVAEHPNHNVDFVLTDTVPIGPLVAKNTELQEPAMGLKMCIQL